MPFGCAQKTPITEMDPILLLRMQLTGLGEEAPFLDPDEIEERRAFLESRLRVLQAVPQEVELVYRFFLGLKEKTPSPWANQRIASWLLSLGRTREAARFHEGPLGGCAPFEFRVEAEVRYYLASKGVELTDLAMEFLVQMVRNMLAEKYCRKVP